MAINGIEDIKEQRDYVLYSRDVVHKHSPAVREFLDFFLNHIDYAQNEAANGKKAIFFSYDQYFPLVYAAGITPIFVPELARSGRSQDTNAAIEALLVPEEVCPMVKSTIGGYYRYRNGNIKTIVIDAALCNPQTASIQLVRSYGYNCYLVDDLGEPITNDPVRRDAQRKKREEQVNKLIQFLTDGKGLDPDKLKYELERANRLNDKGQYFLSLLKNHRSYVKSLAIMLIISGCDHYYGQPEKFERILDDLIKEIENLKDNEFNDELVPLVWNGPRGVDFAVYHSVDESSAYIKEWWGPMGQKRHFNITENVTKAWESASNKAFISISTELDGIEERYKKSQAKGIILFSTLGCTRISLTTEIKRRFLTDKNIPSIAIAGGGQVGDAAGQILTRIRAFVEMVN